MSKPNSPFGYKSMQPDKTRNYCLPAFQFTSGGVLGIYLSELRLSCAVATPGRCVLETGPRTLGTSVEIGEFLR